MNSTRLDRFFAQVLDLDSTAIYGDERDRLRWYESIAVVASVQLIVVPWALLGFAIVDATRYEPVLWGVFLVFTIPWVLATTYVERHRVSPVDYRSRKAVLTMLATFLPSIAFIVVMVVATNDAWSGPLIGGLIGGSVGVVGAVAWGLLRYRARG
jgi:hypothetical protein